MQDIDTTFNKIFSRIGSYRYNLNSASNKQYPSHLIENMYAVYAKHCKQELITESEHKLIEMLAYDSFDEIKDLVYINGEFHKCVPTKPKLIKLKRKLQHQA